jgi:hypothetical protein
MGPADRFGFILSAGDGTRLRRTESRQALNAEHPESNKTHMQDQNSKSKAKRNNTTAQLEHIEAIEKRLWNAADTLRSNSNYASNEYFMPVMGLIFLRHAYSRYLAVKDDIEAGLPKRGGKARALAKEDFSRKSAIFLRPAARFDHLVGLTDSDDRAKAIIDAMESIEADYETLRGVLERNPLRTDFQRHYEAIVTDYNREKDRLTLEKTFESLLRFMQGLGVEDARHLREGLDEEALAVFDLLKRPDLDAAGIKRVKAVAVELLRTLKAEKLRIDHWRDKETTRDDVRISIHDFLYSEATGLPISSYSEAEVGIRSEGVFRHVYWAYPTVPSPYYGAQA